MLEKFGYSFNQTLKIWQRADFAGIPYSDGDSTELSISEIIANAKDLSVLSEELSQRCSDWPTTYHLSPTRANLLRPLQKLFSGEVLEIGSGCGAITRFLGESGGNILALEGSPRRAAITRSRTRDLNNVTVVSDNFDSFNCEKRFDVVTMIGVFEYAEMFIPGEDSASKMLRKAQELLKPNGKLIIAIENQLGLKYFAGAPEDHMWSPMYGIEGRYESGQPRTFGRKELTQLLEGAGYENSEFLAPFPDYKLPVSVISEHGFTDPSFDASALAWQSVWKDPQLPRALNFSPVFTWPIVARNGIALDLANSFLVVASSAKEPTLSENELAWHFSTDRKKRFCKVTEFIKRDAYVEIEYSRPRELEQAELPSTSPSLHQSLSSSCKYEDGEILSWELLRILSKENWKLDELVNFATKYLSCIKSICEADGYSIDIAHNDSLLPGYLWDCIPQNIVKKHSGESLFIDREWASTREIEIGYLLYRGLLPAFHSVAPYDLNAHDFDGTRIGLLQAVVKQLGLNLSREKIYTYAAFETEVQADTNSNPLKLDVIINWLNEALPIQLINTKTVSNSLATISDLREELNILKNTSQRLISTISEQQDRANELNISLARREQELADCNSVLANYQTINQELERTIAHHESLLANYQTSSQELEKTIAQRELDIGGFSEHIDRLNEQLSEVTQSLEKSRELIRNLMLSKSWKMTEPARRLARDIRRAKKALKLSPHAIAHGGGLKKSLRKALRILRHEGLNGVRQRLRSVDARRSHRPIPATLSEEQRILSPLKLTPYYIDPRLDHKRGDDEERLSIANSTVALHVHIACPNNLGELLNYLKNIRFNFDLYLSCHSEHDLESIYLEIKHALPLANTVIKRSTPTNHQGLASLVLGFGEALLGYDVVGHFCTTLSSGLPDYIPVSRKEWGLLLGQAETSGERVIHIIEKLKASSKLIFSEQSPSSVFELAKEPNLDLLVKEILERLESSSINPLLDHDLPKVSCFWARRDCLEPLLKRSSDFIDLADGLPSPALENVFNNLLLALSIPVDGEYLRLHESDSIDDYQYYEPQVDFSSSLVHEELKVLAFYLPQFHPIPENDEWHGVGFTEWTKVRSANPLFEGHYQQHIPHQDLGYYLLDSAETLHKQASLMKKAGVYGQIFYHYWFGGKLILEKPAQMLLNSPEVEMPFCFCWANENWTRRWDGNESEVLLAQNYSDQDAREFIRYLIPFFKDPRYVTVEGQPVLFVYRPSSIPDPKSYLRIWKEECLAAGLPSPYVVAVLTRGAVNPDDFGMHAGVERVLHDWTDGAVPDIRQTLKPYTKLDGSILNYKDVANFYSVQTEKRNFTYFRSIVPIWDNTARYGKDAYVVHGSTPKLFQQWFEALVRYSKDSLPADRRFIIVNAWNEWAEGAHLEPDSRYGYSYLNSIGRCLSGLEYGLTPESGPTREHPIRVHLTLHKDLLGVLSQDPSTTKQLSHLLSQSSLFKSCAVSTNNTLLQSICPAELGDASKAEIIADIRKPVLFSPNLLEELVNVALNNQHAIAIPNSYCKDSFLMASTDEVTEVKEAQKASIIAYSVNTQLSGSFKFCKIIKNSLTLPLWSGSTKRLDDTPKVTTIIRFHKSGELKLLRNALSCLKAMRNCICIPFIAAQDLSQQQTKDLSNLLAEFPWDDNHQPVVHHFSSKDGKGDLRSKMLNESLLSVKSRYAAFLDYDDLLFPDAYEWLIKRLKATNKAVAFGRVYSTSFDSDTGFLLDRVKAFEYGYSYADFFNNNHAPLHSFLLDLSKLDLRQLAYYDEHKYMEDYFLTLQLFSEENGDWVGLQSNHYIGDYIHSINRAHTLAFADDNERDKMHVDPEYLVCLDRINKLRSKIASRDLSVSGKASIDICVVS